MNIGVLTSSRADYGIYLPLLKALKDDPFFKLSIVAFGTHLSPFHGRTIKQINDDGFDVPFQISSILVSDDENSVSSSFAITALKFAEFWKDHKQYFDIILCLGDRFEMFGAVTAGIPFGIPFAHIHGGETTLGAIDNIYRHSISLASAIHFTSTEAYSKKVEDLTGSSQNIYTVGALSLDNLQTMEMLSKEAFQERWKINLDIPTVLITIHPETVTPEKNKYNVQVVQAALEKLAEDYQLIITMPNSDTLSSLYRICFQSFATKYPENVKLVENFGTQSYFSAMKYSKFLLGNTSSGIIEAATFNKYVINLGNRQQGRFAGENVLHVSFEEDKILEAVKFIEASEEYSGENPYDRGGAANKILDVLKTYEGE